MRDDRRALRSVLIDAIAGENRLRREALREEAQAEKWAGRVVFAEARGLIELAEAASNRRERHLRMAGLLRRRAGELHREVARLRNEIGPSGEGGRAPPEVDDVAAQFEQLELEQELDQLRSKRVTLSEQ